MNFTCIQLDPNLNIQIVYRGGFDAISIKLYHQDKTEFPDFQEEGGGFYAHSHIKYLNYCSMW